MGHNHPVTDGDRNHFVIDPITRQITNNTSKLTLIKNDHNSEEFTFELPYSVEGHDMSSCNKIEVHFINVDSKTREPSTGVFPASNIQKVTVNGEDKMTFSWLVSGEATAFAGTLSFAVRFKCLEGTKLVYAWNTAIYSGINVLDGIDNSETEIQEHIDILEEWYRKLDEATKPLSYVGFIESGTIPQNGDIKEFNKQNFNITSINKSDSFYTIIKGEDGTEVSGKSWLAVMVVNTVVNDIVTCTIENILEISGVPGPQGIQGDPNKLTIGSVVTGEEASATIEGEAPNQTLNLVLPKGDKGDKGDPNKLTIGSVVTGEEASATIEGEAPNQTLNLVLPKGDKGDSSLSFNETLVFDSVPEINSTQYSDLKYFNRTPKFGETFIYPAFTRDKKTSFIVQGLVAAVGEYVDYTILNVLITTGATGAKLVNQVLESQDENGGNIYLQTFDDGTTQKFTAPRGLQGIAGVCSLMYTDNPVVSDETIGDYNGADTVILVKDFFNREPVIDDTLIAYGKKSDDIPLILYLKVLSVVDLDVTCEILLIKEIIGKQGETGAKIISTELIGQDENGGNIYRQTFDDGSTFEFVAPKGEKGDTGAKIISTELIGQDVNGGNIYRQTFDNGTTAEFTAPKGEAGDVSRSEYDAFVNSIVGSGKALSGYNNNKGTIEERLTRLGFKSGGVLFTKNSGSQDSQGTGTNSLIKIGDYCIANIDYYPGDITYNAKTNNEVYIGIIPESFSPPSTSSDEWNNVYLLGTVRFTQSKDGINAFMDYPCLFRIERPTNNSILKTSLLYIDCIYNKGAGIPSEAFEYYDPNDNKYYSYTLGGSLNEGGSGFDLSETHSVHHIVIRNAGWICG